MNILPSSYNTLVFSKGSPEAKIKWLPQGVRDNSTGLLNKHRSRSMVLKQR